MFSPLRFQFAKRACILFSDVNSRVFVVRNVDTSDMAGEGSTRQEIW